MEYPLHLKVITRCCSARTRPSPLLLMDATSRIWPPPTPSPPPFSSWPRASLSQHRRCRRHSKKTKPPPQSADSSALPPELVHKALAAAYASDVAAANHACRDALRPLREVAALHAYGPVMGAAASAAARGSGVSVRHEAERQRTLGLAARLGSAAAMVDAGLMCWEEGRREEAVEYYRSAAGLGHPVGMCNLGVSYLEGLLDGQHRDSLEAGAQTLQETALLFHPKKQAEGTMMLAKGQGADGVPS
ncbi:F-box protein At1g70590-like [Phragmites australis]|uniref:F-box protein At1g70590-like n=1 Tax=Phragmites australis TaxID=29695 RepID=UPI002D76EF7E|nr:F-box protein At1g70590-like [Phragmites australis]